MNASHETIEKIISLEWDMFDSVNAGGARAQCQEDYGTFSGMRAAQFGAWTQAVAESYLNDLKQAFKSGRNLVAEKYIHMMKTTEPVEYEILAQGIPQLSDRVHELAREISDNLLEQTRGLFETYPYVSGNGRPLYSVLDDIGSVSVETYQLSELLTYSESTLELLKGHINELAESGGVLAQKILENTVAFYGYTSLDAAEDAAKERMNKANFQNSFGCSSCPK